jgi:glyoxylase-like metal-dependent hydrolase (beta-lactamase superfamily II)
MARGDCFEAPAGTSTDLYYVDTGMFDTAGYGGAYILDAERPALVDTGIGTHYDVILSAMAEVGIAPEDLAVIAPTHVHLDHAGGVGHLADACPGATVCCHEAGVAHLVDPGRLWAGTKAAVGDLVEFYTEPEPVPEDRTRALADGDTVDLGDHALEVHHAPGHAPHQAVFYDPENDGVFTADAAGICTPGLDGVRQTSPPPDFDLAQVLAELDASALYYPHFGDHEPDGLLATYATVIEEWVAEVRRQRERLGEDEAVVEYFLEQTAPVGAWGQRKARGEERMNVRGVLGYLDRHGDD